MKRYFKILITIQLVMLVFFGIIWLLSFLPKFILLLVIMWIVVPAFIALLFVPWYGENGPLMMMTKVLIPGGSVKNDK